MPHKLFCTYGPICYHISEVKEQLKRRLIDFVTGMRFASHHQQVTLPVLVKGHSTLMLRPLEGVNMALQQSKVTNLRLAAAKLHNLVIEPGETFSFWHTIGSCTKKKAMGQG
ncbi:MAG: VanW family protein [Oscillospiraceae bacterium]